MADQSAGGAGPGLALAWVRTSWAPARCGTARRGWTAHHEFLQHATTPRRPRADGSTPPSGAVISEGCSPSSPRTRAPSPGRAAAHSHHQAGTAGQQREQRRRDVTGDEPDVRDEVGDERQHTPQHDQGHTHDRQRSCAPTGWADLATAASRFAAPARPVGGAAAPQVRKAPNSSVDVVGPGLGGWSHAAVEAVAAVADEQGAGAVSGVPGPDLQVAGERGGRGGVQRDEPGPAVERSRRLGI